MPSFLAGPPSSLPSFLPTLLPSSSLPFFTTLFFSVPSFLAKIPFFLAKVPFFLATYLRTYLPTYLLFPPSSSSLHPLPPSILFPPPSSSFLRRLPQNEAQEAQEKAQDGTGVSVSRMIRDLFCVWHQFSLSFWPFWQNSRSVHQDNTPNAFERDFISGTPRTRKSKFPIISALTLLTRCVGFLPLEEIRPRDHPQSNLGDSRDYHCADEEELTTAGSGYWHATQDTSTRATLRIPQLSQVSRTCVKVSASIGRVSAFSALHSPRLATSPLTSLIHTLILTLTLILILILILVAPPLPLPLPLLLTQKRAHIPPDTVQDRKHVPRTR